jgi:hypothetical protein
MYNPIIKKEFLNESRKSSTEQYVNLLETVLNIATDDITQETYLVRPSVK